ncbi:hypothetical protein FZI85_25290 [Mycobacterium sp. CBMA293]|nr:hypothetical protein [Mycolicibacterium sp. CBMA 213]MUM14322.1 hypothetical protein [Mycolicibacterium sp. CBMA 293]
MQRWAVDDKPAAENATGVRNLFSAISGENIKKVHALKFEPDMRGDITRFWQLPAILDERGLHKADRPR